MLLSGAVLAGCGEPEPAHGDVLLIIVDTLRADALSSYGNPQPTTPHLDALAADGLRFAEVLTQAPNTAPSHATLFTGLTPWTHRVANLTSLELGTPGLPPAFITLAERFRGRGYATAAFTDGGPVGTAWNLMQGFDVLEAEYEGAAPKVDDALAYWADAGDDRPRFVFLHTYQVHEPYLPPLEYRERFNSNPDYDGVVLESEARARVLRTDGGEVEPNGKVLFEHKDAFGPADVRYLWDLYQAELAYTDAELGRLFQALKDSGRYDDMTIIVTSDHGEEFGEHGEFGHLRLNHETLHVPLIVKLPAGLHDDWRGRVVEERVNQVDVHATLVDLLGDDWPVGPGRSLFDDLEEGVFEERVSFSETTESLYYAREVQFDHVRGQRAVRFGEYALVEDLAGGSVFSELRKARPGNAPLEPAPAPLGRTSMPPRPEDEVSDPKLEPVRRSLSGRIARHLAGAIELRNELLAGESTSFFYKVDGATRSELEALGYVDGEGVPVVAPPEDGPAPVDEKGDDER